MQKSTLLLLLILFSNVINAKTVVVKNDEELNKANAIAKPGDSVILQNGEWKNCKIELNAKGNSLHPIVFIAQTPGKVIITGFSTLKIGGEYLEINGLNFTNGYSGEDAVITFQINKKQLANHCRVTNTVINGFNNTKRLDQNYWISFYGQFNRLDHCSIENKLNMGVILAVILDDDRSRMNFHSIDHNYFGYRLPLASNTGEIIRVGVSEHCEFNSNTTITNNLFEHCDGEAEVISIKSCSNQISNNVFKECQGNVVLRHGNYNTVENNIFLGNGKAGTGGVRVINKWNWVVNNLFYQCRGVDFRSPLSIMNGVPNSPAYRYVAVSEAVIANNSFVDCSPMSFCEGSDAERSVQPKNVEFVNNLVLNNLGGPIYFQNDDISGIHFSGNVVNTEISQKLTEGFIKTPISSIKMDGIGFPSTALKTVKLSDSLQRVSIKRLEHPLVEKAGFSDIKSLKTITQKSYDATGAFWFSKKSTIQTSKNIVVNCSTGQEVIEALKNSLSNNLTILLTAQNYTFEAPLEINQNVEIKSSNKGFITFNNTNVSLPHFIQLHAGNSLSLQNLQIDLKNIQNKVFITLDTSESCLHSNLEIMNCNFKNANQPFFNAPKSSVLDSMLVKNNGFSNFKGTLFNFGNENDNKGYYNVEHLFINNNTFENGEGQLLTMLRSGKDESTMGPFMYFKNNTINNLQTKDNTSLIYLFGTQNSWITENTISNANSGKQLVIYEDAVKAKHIIENNTIQASGSVIKNKYVLNN